MSAQTFTATLGGETIKVRARSAEQAKQKAFAIFSDRQAGIMARRKNRETGTEILLVDRTKLPGRDDFQKSSTEGPEQRWETICDAHSTVCSHETREIAESFMAVPTEWCEDCQAAYSTDGKGAWADDYIPERKD